MSSCVSVFFPVLYKYLKIDQSAVLKIFVNIMVWHHKDIFMFLLSSEVLLVMWQFLSFKEIKF